MKQNNIKKENGFISAFFLIFLVTLGLMGAGGYVLVSSESKNIVNQFQVLQADYAANGAAYYGISRVSSGFRVGTEELSVGDSEVDLNVVQTIDANGDSVTRLTVMASVSNIERSIVIDIRSRGLEDMAIVTEGNVINIDVLDSTGTEDDDYLISQIDSIPELNADSLFTIAGSQGHIVSGNVDVGGKTDYPPGQSSFYYNGNPANGPNVTWITGNLTFSGTCNLWGIFVVEGSVTMSGNTQLQGVLYLPNPASTIIHGTGSDDKVVGGIISHGNITGYGNPAVRHGPDYMESIAGFQTNPNYLMTDVLLWTYQ